MGNGFFFIASILALDALIMNFVHVFLNSLNLPIFGIGLESLAFEVVFYYHHLTTLCPPTFLKRVLSFIL